MRIFKRKLGKYDNLFRFLRLLDVSKPRSNLHFSILFYCMIFINEEMSFISSFSDRLLPGFGFERFSECLSSFSGNYFGIFSVEFPGIRNLS